MGRLLTQVAQRLNGKGGEPVIQLQTAFGGGKTHTLLAVYHLASRQCPLGDLVGIPALLDKTGLMDVPSAQIAVLDGAAHSPGQPWKHGKQTIRTLWGELAWQLGKADGFALVQESDANGTSPGKDVLCELLTRYAPCVVLLDELVVYIRQFVESQPLSGGTYDSNLSFIQSLTEAAKLVPNAVVLPTIDDSRAELTIVPPATDDSGAELTTGARWPGGRGALFSTEARSPADCAGRFTSATRWPVPFRPAFLIKS
jgi:hypothetical protein